MARYIDADALREKMYHEAFEKDSQDQKWDSGCWIRYHMFEDAIESIPTDDVVKVVRCKDCKHHTEEDLGMVYCPHIVGGGESMFHFCSHGERREDVEETD